MQRFLAVVVAVQLVAGGVAVVLDNLPKRTRTIPVNETRLRPGQTEVTGTLTLLKADAAVPSEPLALPVAITGGGATVANAVVGGKPSTIVWDGGRPLNITGAGTIDLAGAAVEVDGGGVRWFLDGAPRAFAPGTYRIATPVAVGTTGLARPRDNVEFTASATTAIATRGNARLQRPLAPMTLEGPGTVRLEGTLRVRTPDDDDAAAPRTVTLQGAYRITVTPTPTGLQVMALFQQG